MLPSPRSRLHAPVPALPSPPSHPRPSIPALPSPHYRPRTTVPTLPSPHSRPHNPIPKNKSFQSYNKKLLPSPYFCPLFLECHVPLQYFIHARGDVVVEAEIIIMWKCCEVYFGVTCKKLEGIKLQETYSYWQCTTSTNKLLLTKIWYGTTRSYVNKLTQKMITCLPNKLINWHRKWEHVSPWNIDK